MDVIRLLPDSVANQIAAGEVIQRPASCLKELVENSIDAGAQTIRVLVRDAGKTLIRVIDDGSGMSPSDARMAFERHATSKIRSAEDIYRLRTMGFRGEALPSICAVAQVEMTTRREQDEMGTRLDIAGSRVISQEVCQCVTGTNIAVQNLFFNVPARRRFLKSDQTELRNLITTFQHIVLVYPDVAFTFVSDDEIIYDLPTGTLKQRIEGVFGRNKHKQYTSQLVDVEQSTELVAIHGYVGKPEMAQKQSQQFFFVNGRYMRHPYFHKAVMQAYQGMLPPEQVPPYFIYFDIDPEQIDVNVHPTKTEIKFADEQAIFPILSACVRGALGKFNVLPSIDFLGGNIEMPVSDTATRISAQPPQIHSTTDYNPFKTTNSRPDPHWQSLYEPLLSPTLERKRVGETEMFDSESEFSADELRIALQDETVKPMQMSRGYIVLPIQDGILLIHPRRAHILLLYRQFLSQFDGVQGLRQQLLFPESVALSTEEMMLLRSLQPDLEKVGFRFEQATPISSEEAGLVEPISVTAQPALLGGQSAEATLRAILARAAENENAPIDALRQQTALTLAQSAAIPMGKQLTEKEMNGMLAELMNTDNYRITPDGKTVCALISMQQIGKLFA